MRIGGLDNIYPTYVYNPNLISSKSMNKLSKISDDVLDKKVDYTGIKAKEENRNPLKKGQTLNFNGILAKQMQQSRSRAARLMSNKTTPVKKTDKTVRNAKTANTVNTGMAQMQKALQAYGMFMTV